MPINYFDPESYDTNSPNEYLIRRYTRHATFAVLEWGKKEFRFSPDLPLKYKMDFLPTREQRSSGGTQGTIGCQTGVVELKMRRVLKGNWQFWKEYYHVSQDHEIGSRECVSWQEYVLCLVCHEVSHVLEHIPGYGGQIPKERSPWPPLPKHIQYSSGEHGDRWQTIYRRIRNHFVNYSPELYVIPDEVLEHPGETLGRVIIKHGFSSGFFTRGEFNLIKDFEPTPEAIMNNEQYGIPVNVGYLQIETDDGVKRVEVKKKDYQYV